MAEAISIPNRKSTNDVTDIRFLRETGLRLLQQYSGNVWTDYNTHDPGVTILEVLCLALAEVGYRAEYDLTELLGKHAVPGPENGFFPPETVLPSSPVTISDMRKLLLDIDGLHNVRIRRDTNTPEFSGLYEVEALLESDAADEWQDIARVIRQMLNEHRQPGQDFVSVSFLQSEKIGFELDLEVGQRVDSNDFFHLIASAIENYLSPSVHFSSMEELKAKHKTTTEIFDGPMLGRSGFLTEETLESSRLRNNIYTSDLISVLMKAKDVQSVRKIILSDETGKTYNWSYSIKAGKVPRIDYSKTKITIRYRGSIISSGTIAHIRTSRNVRSLPKPFVQKTKEITDNDERLREFYSVGQDLPDIYGVGEYGLPYSASPQREAQVHQLRAYLSIFDQLLSGAFAQLAYARHLLSPAPLSHTYEAGNIRHLDSGEYLFKPFLDQYLAEHLEIKDQQHLSREWKKYLELNLPVIEKKFQKLSETDLIFHDRRSRALSHLLSRFGYDLTFFEYVCGFTEEEQIRYKELLIDLLPQNDKMRSVLRPPSGNYLRKKREPFSGLELRIALITGIRAAERKALSPAIDQLFAGETETNGTIDIEVFANGNEDAVDLLIASGGRKEMYVTGEDESGFFTMLYDNHHQPRAKFRTAEYDPALEEKLAAAFYKADLESEGFHLIDHLLLRPAGEIPCFGFEISTGKSPDFICAPELSRTERDKVKEAFLAGAAKTESYFITETAIRQFRIGNHASAHLKGAQYYSNREEANAAIEEYVRFFSNQQNETAFRFTNAFRDIYSDTDDPFSGIVTMVLPSWPSRFSNQAYKRYIEETISREMPAHLIVNIRWMNLDAMKAFEDAYSSWLNIPEENGISISEKKKRLVTLMKLLADS